MKRPIHMAAYPRLGAKTIKVLCGKRATWYRTVARVEHATCPTCIEQYRWLQEAVEYIKQHPND